MGSRPRGLYRPTAGGARPWSIAALGRAPQRRSAAGAPRRAPNGAGLLNHVFGAQTPQAANLLGQKTGLDSNTALKVLAVAGPIVMSILANKFGPQGDANQLSQALGEENRQTGGGGIGDLLGGVLDQDGDGKFGVSDVLGLLGGKR